MAGRLQPSTSAAKPTAAMPSTCRTACCPTCCRRPSRSRAWWAPRAPETAPAERGGIARGDTLGRMFNPSQDDVRRFFCSVYAKSRQGLAMEAIETLAGQWISEQCSIDQPRGIRQAVELLTARRDSLHGAHHETMEFLGRMLWESQRSGRPPDGHAYIDSVQRAATRD